MDASDIDAGHLTYCYPQTDDGPVLAFYTQELLQENEDPSFRARCFEVERPQAPPSPQQFDSELENLLNSYLGHQEDTETAYEAHNSEFETGVFVASTPPCDLPDQDGFFPPIGVMGDMTSFVPPPAVMSNMTPRNDILIQNPAPLSGPLSQPPATRPWPGSIPILEPLQATNAPYYAQLPFWIPAGSPQPMPMFPEDSNLQGLREQDRASSANILSGQSLRGVNRPQPHDGQTPAFVSCEQLELARHGAPVVHATGRKVQSTAAVRDPPMLTLTPSAPPLGQVDGSRDPYYHAHQHVLREQAAQRALDSQLDDGRMGTLANMELERGEHAALQEPNHLPEASSHQPNSSSTGQVTGANAVSDKLPSQCPSASPGPYKPLQASSNLNPSEAPVTDRTGKPLPPITSGIKTGTVPIPPFITELVDDVHHLSKNHSGFPARKQLATFESKKNPQDHFKEHTSFTHGGFLKKKGKLNEWAGDERLFSFRMWHYLIGTPLMRHFREESGY